jgi:hypothetical protein
MIKTNDLKKGDRVQLRSGWYATVMDNMKGNIRMLDVEGFSRETGSAYAHDIVLKINKSGINEAIEHTEAQIKLRSTVETLFG